MAKSKNATAVRLVREFFQKASDEGVAQQVWDLVSALRGPDDKNLAVKDRTTAFIRGRLYPPGSNPYIRIDRYTDKRGRSVRINLKHATPSGPHFTGHIAAAIKVLNGK